MGEIVVVGLVYGKVWVMIDDWGDWVDKVSLFFVVEVFGFRDVF